MRDKDVIQHIQDLCKERSWTYPYPAEALRRFRHHTCRFLSRRAGCPAAYRRTAGNHYALQ